MTKQSNLPMILLLLISFYSFQSFFDVSAEGELKGTVLLENKNYNGVSNQRIWLQYPDERCTVKNCTFSNSQSSQLGGALYIQISNRAPGYMANCTFTNCSSSNNGGALWLDIGTGTVFTMEGLIKFKNCSGLVGGALWLSIGSGTSQLIVNQVQFEDCSSSSFGGGMHLLCKLQAIVNIEQLTFKNCSSLSRGGGIHIISEMQGNIQINKITADNCKCTKGNGGGIYASIDFGASSQLKMTEITALNCQAKNDTSSTSPTGYGGGIFITGNGDYNAVSKVLDFKKMKFNGNTAEKAGQTMYVAITKVAEWCRTGTAGEYVKGNYTDGTSSKGELVGIPVNNYTFVSYSTSTINSQQKYLEDYWNVDRVEYYIKSGGSDSSQCTSFVPCLSFEAQLIKDHINDATSVLVYIYDTTYIVNTAVISQLATPRTFRNYPLTSTTPSVILIRSSGGFNVTGKVRFQLIKFIIDNSVSLQDNPVIYGKASTAEVDLQDCQFSVQNAGSQIEKSFVSLIKGGNHIISNLKTKDISSLKNIIFVDFDEAGQIRISDSQFENITKNDDQVIGGTVSATLFHSSNRIDITDCTFTSCKAQGTWGGAIFINTKNSTIVATISRTQISKCEAQRGGGLFVRTEFGGQIVIDNQCVFKECKANAGNGGGIKAELNYTTGTVTSFLIQDALIQDCKAFPSTQHPSSTGFGGGICIGVTGTYDVASQSIDLHGMKIYGNTADKNGKSLYVVMTKLKEWCETGLLGEYVKGNYSDDTSTETDLEGFVMDFRDFYTLLPSQTDQKILEHYWNSPIPSFSIWHVLYRNGGQQGSDNSDCGEVAASCKTIEHAIKQVSLKKAGSIEQYVEVKNIGINQNGYDLQYPMQLSKSDSHTDVIKIMKQMYGTPTQMTGNAEIKILKNNDNTKESNKQGWISASEGLQLRFYCINIIMDTISKLSIPIVYIQGTNSILELNTVTFSGIKLSPTSEPKGIVEIKVDNSQLIGTNSKFQNIEIESIGGNAIRIENSGSNPITATLTGCEFNTINSIGDSNGRGGSAIYMENKHGSKLVIDGSSKFLKCVINEGNGGAIYMATDCSSQFEFKINDGLIQECKAKSDTNKDVPATGYGGGIYIIGSQDYDVSTSGIDFRGLKIYKNTADKAGQSIYIVMRNLAELVRQGDDGEYIKGNYTTGISDKTELEGIPANQSTYETLPTSEIEEQQRDLEYFWSHPSHSIYHIKYRNGGQHNGEDQQWCGNWDEACLTMQYAIDQISINKGGLAATKVDEKDIGISQIGYDLTNPIQLSKSGSHADVIKIMKQMYDTPSQMTGNAEIKILKNDDNTKEDGKQGWISASEGLQLRFYCINIIMDAISKLSIPIVYIEGTNSILELNTVTFSGIKLSPTSNPKGIVQINVDNTQLIGTNSKFQNIEIESKGGNAIRIENSGSNPITATLTGCEFNTINSIGDSNGRGGSAIYMENKHGSKLVIDGSSKFLKCIIDKGNGGAIYMATDCSSQFEFKINDGLIQECKAKSDTNKDVPATGYGGGIYIIGSQDYDVSTSGIDFRGLKIYKNTADKAGQSIYIVMRNLAELVRQGDDGEYVKGNYTTGISDKTELEGIPTNQSTYETLPISEIEQQQRDLEYFWSHPSHSIYHIKYRSGGQNNGEDQQWCGNWDEACLTMKYAIDQISINKGGLAATKVDEKDIGISQIGYDLTNPIELSKSGSHADVIKIMKQMYGTPSQMTGNAEIKILKNNDNTKEDGKQGWISASEGLQLRFYCINIIMDAISKLSIPIVYIEGTNSILELNTVTFSGIKLSPTSEPKGIVEIKVDNSQLIGTNSKFQNIEIESKGGNAIRIENSGSNPITATLTGCEFNTINSIGDSNGRGGSAIYMENKHGSKLVIDGSSKFLKCVINEGNGGAIYMATDCSSQFEFKINDGLIQECKAKSDTIKDVPATGYGGGIYIIGSQDYDVSTSGIDFRGLKIYKNTADKAGQSIYIVMRKLAELCQYGIDGEYIKGNYTSGISDKSELVGIPIDSTTFNSYSTETINSQQNYLEDYWIDNRNEFYVKDSGSNAWLCTQSSPCKTLDVSLIQSNINSQTTFLVYIYDITSIENTAVISQTTSPRIFRNYPLTSTTPSDILIKSGGGFNIIGKVRFQQINFIMESSGLQLNNPGIYGIESTAEINLQFCQFHMQNAQSQIGRCFVNILKGGDHIISNLKAKDISSLENIIKVDFEEVGLLSISDSQFENITKISSSITGGIVRAVLSHSSNKLDITDCIFTSCKAQGTFGGAIYAEIQNSNAQVTLTRTQVLYCEASKGGGLFVKIDNGGQFIIQSSCELKECKATSGNGGGIYAELTYSASIQTSFLIKDALIQDCQAISSSANTGFGGGIFIGGTGDYIASTKRLDLKRMKISGNTASKGGQSLYAVMPKLEEWCKYGTLGEYVKGDYDDINSDLSELEGIPQDLETFNTLPSDEIEEQQYQLQYYWSEIALLTGANAVINESNTDLPLQISLKGSNFITEQFYAKIVELGSKTQFNKKLTLIQLNAIDVIYPPEDGTGDPIDIQGDPQNEQDASFGMKDISWMDYKNKKYGMLTSNDRRIFTGVGGRQNKAVPLEVKIEEAPVIIDKEVVIVEPSQPKEYGIPSWATALVVVGVLSALAGAILSTLCCCLCPCCLCFKCWDNDEQRVKNIRDDFEKIKIEHQRHLREINTYDVYSRSLNNQRVKQSRSRKQQRSNQMIEEGYLFGESQQYNKQANQYLNMQEPINRDSTKGFNSHHSHRANSNSFNSYHKSLLVPYENDFVNATSQSKDQLEIIQMTEFAKQPQQDGSYNSKSSLYNRPEEKLGPTQNSTGNSQVLQSYTQDLKNKLDVMEQYNGQQGSNPKLPRKSTKDFMEFPKEEKGTLNEKIADFFSQAKPTTIDFSAMPADDPQLRGINWGASGPPATIGLGSQGVTKPPKEIIVLQQRQERLLSKSSTNYSTPVSRQRTSTNGKQYQQGKPISPKTPSQINSFNKPLNSHPNSGPGSATTGPLSPNGQQQQQQQRTIQSKSSNPQYLHTLQTTSKK